MPMDVWPRNALVASAAYVKRCTITAGGAKLRAAPDCASLHAVGGLHDKGRPSCEDPVGIGH